MTVFAIDRRAAASAWHSEGRGAPTGSVEGAAEVRDRAVSAVAKYYLESAKRAELAESRSSELIALFEFASCMSGAGSSLVARNPARDTDTGLGSLLSPTKHAAGPESVLCV